MNIKNEVEYHMKHVTFVRGTQPLRVITPVSHQSSLIRMKITETKLMVLHFKLVVWARAVSEVTLESEQSSPHYESLWRVRRDLWLRANSEYIADCLAFFSPQKLSENENCDREGAEVGLFCSPVWNKCLSACFPFAGGYLSFIHDKSLKGSVIRFYTKQCPKPALSTFSSVRNTEWSGCTTCSYIWIRKQMLCEARHLFSEFMVAISLRMLYRFCKSPTPMIVSGKAEH